jgi:hypothetical protein
MKPITEILQNRSLSTTTTQVGPKVSSFQTEQDARFINTLFRKLQAISPAWKQAFATSADVAEAKREWTIGLVAAGITSDELVEYGLAQARRSISPFLPSLGQFIRWCETGSRALSGLPTVDQAYEQIVRATNVALSDYIDWRAVHPAVYHTYRNNLDTHNWCCSDRQTHRNKFDAAYRVTRQQIADGAELDTPPARYIAVSEPVPCSRESSLKHIAALKAVVSHHA